MYQNNNNLKLLKWFQFLFKIKKNLKEYSIPSSLVININGILELFTTKRFVEK